MEYLIGAILALAVGGFATLIGLDRGRAFYPTVLIVIATYYVLFAVMGGSTRVLLVEIAFASVVSLIAIIGFRKNLWIVVAALVGHGVFDFVHHLFIEDPGVPNWWPGFCMAYDVIAGAWLAMRLSSRWLSPGESGRHAI